MSSINTELTEESNYIFIFFFTISKYSVNKIERQRMFMSNDITVLNAKYLSFFWLEFYFVLFSSAQELLNTGIFTIAYAITTLFQLINWASVNYYGRASNITAAVSNTQTHIIFHFIRALNRVFMPLTQTISYVSVHFYFFFRFFSRFLDYSTLSHTLHQHTFCFWNIKLEQLIRWD